MYARFYRADRVWNVTVARLMVSMFRMLGAKMQSVALSDDDAGKLADRWQFKDPFPDIACSLLSSEHIQIYVQQTAMLHPFYPSKDKLKSASYEINPGGKFIRWDENGKYIENEICDGDICVLPANSITFIQLGTKIRLPQYIAMRFNLRIKHVHRGILLGTGPLVDPGYRGNLLIPLHNLTSAEYEIRADEGLIWAEFTKTSHSKEISQDRLDSFVLTPDRLFDKPPEYWLRKAAGSKPIRSSIPIFIADAKEDTKKASRAAQDANAAAQEARKYNEVFTVIGSIALLGLIIAAITMFFQIDGNVMQAMGAATQASSAASDAKSETVKLQSSAETTKTAQLAEINDLRAKYTDSLKRIDDLEKSVLELTKYRSAQQSNSSRLLIRHRSHRDRISGRGRSIR